MKEFYSGLNHSPIPGRDDVALWDFLAWGRKNYGSVKSPVWRHDGLDLRIWDHDGDAVNAVGLPLLSIKETKFSRLAIFVDYWDQAARVQRLLSARRAKYDALLGNDAPLTGSIAVLHHAIILCRERLVNTRPVSISGLDDLWEIPGVDRRCIREYEQRYVRALNAISDKLQEYELEDISQPSLRKIEVIVFNAIKHDEMSDFLIDSSWADYNTRLHDGQEQYIFNLSPIFRSNWGMKPLALRIIRKILSDHLGLNFYIISSN